MKPTDLPTAPAWNGVNHLALVTDDMDATVRFYAGVLGMPLIMTIRAGDIRHYFFELGPRNTVAFFEIDDAETFEKATLSQPGFPVQLDHISFDVADEAALEMLAERLRAAGSEVTEVVDHGVMRSVYFTDNNGIALEASYWVVDGTRKGFDPTDTDRYQDPDPVPAIAELANGELATVPTTSLV